MVQKSAKGRFSASSFKRRRGKEKKALVALLSLGLVEKVDQIHES